ncbi:MAG: 50S ribosomal protein L6 [Desulfobacterales bacterium]|nr:50S ribosomal protein L6 [Desulfobacterales bacterium]
MSRIGKKPIVLPGSVKVAYADRKLVVEGPKGKLEQEIHPTCDLKIDENVMTVEIAQDVRKAGAFHGMTRALVANMVTGVEKGFEKSLEVNGIGYKVEVKGQTVILNVGYSHAVSYELPEGVTASVDRNILKIMGADKQAVGQVAANIRDVRPPEPYKGKGIKYVDEFIQRKAGKTGT